MMTLEDLARNEAEIQQQKSAQDKKFAEAFEIIRLARITLSSNPSQKYLYDIGAVPSAVEGNACGQASSSGLRGF